MSAMCSRCKERPVYALGFCGKCYQWHRRNAMPPIPGLMTPEEATRRRKRIMQEMKAEGYDAQAISERFGGRGVRAGERDVSVGDVD